MVDDEGVFLDDVDNIQEEIFNEYYCENIIVTSEGHKVCADTGEVIGENTIVDYPERVFRDDGRSLPRYGSPTDYSHHALGITVDFSSKRPRNVLKKDKITSIRNTVKKYRALTRTRREEQEIYLFQLLKETAYMLNLGTAQLQEAGLILRELIGKIGVPSAREGRAIIAAIIHKIIEKHNLGISQQEILEKLEVEPCDMWNAKMKLNQSGVLTAINQRAQHSLGQERILARVDTYVTRLVQELGLSMTVRDYSLEFLRVVMKSGKSLYGKKPEVIAAATVYLIARLFGYDISQATLAKILRIRESSIRKLYRFLIDDIVVLVPL